jgi:magnesium transporter
LSPEQAFDLSVISHHQNALIVINNFFDESLLNKIRETFRVHSLVLEDIVNTDQRSKYEKYDNYELCIAREPFSDKQISLLCTSNVVILFQEDVDESCVYHVIGRLQRSESRIRGRDTGYLSYAFIDSVIDDYFVVAELLENEVEEMEKKIEEDKANFSDIAALKRKIVEFRKNALPLREMVIRLHGSREESLFGRDARNFPFLADLVDHCTRIVESADRLRDITFSLVDLHTGMTSAKMNQIMKVLTVITTIFVPITFLTSVYGMNFDGMEEIHWKHGYLAFWAIVVGISGALFAFFKRKKWL